VKNAGLNPYLLEIANLREQISWVHYDDPKKATEKAKGVIAGAVGKVKLNEPLEEVRAPIGKRALVIGAGIAGIQAAVDLADAGFEVYVVEKRPYIGGRMSQLTRTFPTNDCAPCILAPKMAEIVNHENITLFTNSEIIDITGYVGNYEVVVKIFPRYVDVNRCTACGICTEYCPVVLPNEFNWGLDDRKAIYIPSENAVPMKAIIDMEHCIKCTLCSKVCPAEAVDFSQNERIERFKVDTIIVATGFDVMDASMITQYGYGRYKNVMIAPQIERMNVPQGPTGGRIIRPSDGKVPESIAYILCVGSRNKNFYPYCSVICCMYSIKEAGLLKRKLGDSTEITIFYTDIRASGKGFEEYYNAVQKLGVKFVRGRVAEIIEKENGNLILRVEDTLENKKREMEFEMVVLAPAIIPNKDGRKIGEILKLPISEDGFFLESHPKYKPVDTSIQGVFIAGCAQGPKDIPQSVQQGSAAAARAIRLMNQGSVSLSPITAVINENCNGCLSCINSCPYEAIKEREGKVEVNSMVCKGCGICLSSCSLDAIEIKHYKRDQIIAQIKGLLSSGPEPKIIAFLDDWCSYTAVDMAANSRTIYPSNVKIVRVHDGAIITPSLILETFKLGADAVYIGTCEAGGDPFSPKCPEAVENSVKKVREILKNAGIEEERVMFDTYVVVATQKFISAVNKLLKIASDGGKIPKDKLEVI